MMTIREHLEAIRDREIQRGRISSLTHADAVKALAQLDAADFWDVGWPEGNVGGGRFIPDPPGPYPDPYA